MNGSDRGAGDCRYRARVEVVQLIIVLLLSVFLSLMVILLDVVELHVTRVIRGELVVEEIVEIIEESPERVFVCLDKFLVREEAWVHSLVRPQIREDLGEVGCHACCVGRFSDESAHCTAVEFGVRQEVY